MADKRVERTRANVFRAMLDLVCKKDWEKITVKELCAAADINKSTFYLHFSDMFDCREKWLIYTMNQSIAIDGNGSYSFEMVFSNPRPYLNNVLDFFEEHILQYQKLHNSPSFGVYIHEFKRYSMEMICKKNHINPTSDYQKYTLVLFLLGGIVDTIFGSVNNFDRVKLLDSLTNFVSGCVATRSTAPMRSVNAY